MSLKRRNSSSVEPDSPLSDYVTDNTDSVIDQSDVGHHQPRVDQYTGQVGAFPGLADDDGLFYGPATDGLDYLRMVRSERVGIPELLTAAHSHYDLDTNSDAGLYHDGAYTARPINESPQLLAFGPAQSRYYEFQLAHFRLIRATMNCIPPLTQIQSLSDTRPISFPRQSKPARETWENQLLSQNPHPVQVACMDLDSVFGLIGFITRKMYQFFRPGDLETTVRIGAWIWAVLGKCPERGELGGEEVSDLRALAQKAIEISKKLKAEVDDEAMMHSLHHVGDEVPPPRMNTAVEDESDSDMEMVVSSDMLNVANSTEVLSRKLVTLDMVVTIVGQIYGQCDLLELREAWV